MDKIEELEKPTHFITNIISLLCFIAIIIGGFDLDITHIFLHIYIIYTSRKNTVFIKKKKKNWRTLRKQNVQGLKTQ